MVRSDLVVGLLWNLDHLVVGGPLDHLLQDGSVHIGQWHHLLVLENIELQNLTSMLPDSHLLVHAEVLQHGLDGHRLLGDLHVHGEDLAIARLQLDRRHLEPADLSLQGGQNLDNFDESI